MKINDVNRLSINKLYQQTSSKPKDNKLSNHDFTDQLEISSQAQEKLKQTKASQTLQTAKNEQLKKQIADGTYRPNSDRIAGKLISLWIKGSN